MILKLNLQLYFATDLFSLLLTPLKCATKVRRRPRAGHVVNQISFSEWTGEAETLQEDCCNAVAEINLFIKEFLVKTQACKPRRCLAWNGSWSMILCIQQEFTLMSMKIFHQWWITMYVYIYTCVCSNEKVWASKSVWPRIDRFSFIFVLFHMLFIDLATSFEWGVDRKRGHLESIWKALNRHLSAIYTHTLFALSWDQKSNENITRKQIITEHQGGRSSGTAGPVVPESTSSSTKLGSPSIRCFEAKLKKPVPAQWDELDFFAVHASLQSKVLPPCGGASTCGAPPWTHHYLRVAGTFFTPSPESLPDPHHGKGPGPDSAEPLDSCLLCPSGAKPLKHLLAMITFCLLVVSF